MDSQRHGRGAGRAAGPHTKVGDDDGPGGGLAHQLAQPNAAGAAGSSSAACRRPAGHNQHPEQQQRRPGHPKEVEQRPPAKALQDERRQQEAHQVACGGRSTGAATNDSSWQHEGTCERQPHKAPHIGVQPAGLSGSATDWGGPHHTRTPVWKPVNTAPSAVAFLDGSMWRAMRLFMDGRATPGGREKAGARGAGWGERAGCAGGSWAGSPACTACREAALAPLPKLVPPCPLTHPRQSPPGSERPAPPAASAPPPPSRA